MDFYYASSESAISPSAGPTFFQKKVGKETWAFHSAPQAAPVHRMPPYAAPGLLYSSF